jgi:hypothetical protein
MSEVVLESVLVCPVCGFAKRETMPTEACQFFYECAGCKTLLRPEPGDCCVFCSLRFGEVSPDAGRKLSLVYAVNNRPKPSHVRGAQRRCAPKWAAPYGCGIYEQPIN